ncbi:MAG: hypothetical protein QM817_10410 [Archangium sp.]
MSAVKNLFERHPLAVRKTLWFLLAALSAAVVLIIAIVCGGWTGLPEAYVALRGSIFTGFFTIGGFLLTLKNLILGSVRTGVFENKEYQKTHLKKRQGESLYGSLRNLGALIHYAIVGALVTSFAQLTIGLYKSNVTAVVALSLAAGTATLLGACLYELRANLVAWFDQLDKSWEKEAEKLRAEKADG